MPPGEDDGIAPVVGDKAASSGVRGELRAEGRDLFADRVQFRLGPALGEPDGRTRLILAITFCAEQVAVREPAITPPGIEFYSAGVLCGFAVFAKTHLREHGRVVAKPVRNADADSNSLAYTCIDSFSNT